jgi:hypothetical protein
MNGRLSLALLGGAGADVMRGGCANDFLDIDSFDTLIDAGGGTNDVIVVMGSIGINLNITTARGEYVIGGTGNDTLTAVGSANAVVIQGGEGADSITGSNGNDYFYGNAGADIFRVTAKAQFGSLQPCVSALCPGD